MFIESTLDFEIFQFQHFDPSGLELVITDADPDRRRVFGIDGGPAAAEFARLLDLDESELTPEVFSRHPLMLRLGDEWYIRSVSRLNDDGSLDFFCAIEAGIP